MEEDREVFPVMQLKAYQREAVDQLLATIATEPAKAYATGEVYTPPPARLLQAPTGAGKTVILAQLIIELSSLSYAKMRNGTALEIGELVFIVIAPNSLHEQHYQSLDRYGVNRSNGLRLLKKVSITGSFDLEVNDVLVLNWASVNKKTNLLISGGERDNDLASVLDRARQSGKNVVLVQDEAHIQTETLASKKVIEEIIKPAVILNLTATPKPSTGGQQDKNNPPVVIKHQVVVDDGMIVAKAIANDNDLAVFEEELNAIVKKKGLSEPGINERNIYAAIRKSQVMDQHYEQANSPVRTITGVQLPVKEKWLIGEVDSTDMKKDSAVELTALSRTLNFLEKVFGWTVATNEIAIWLSENKDGLTGNEQSIKNYDSPIKVLIFKYALAVGYDLPRMKTGALLHDTKTVSFAIQTLGRFLRQPEQKNYPDDFLNRAYIYTEGDSVAKISNDFNDQVSFPPVAQPLASRVQADPLFLKSLRELSLPNWYNQQHNPNTLHVATLKQAFYTVVNELLNAKRQPELIFDNLYNRLIAPMDLNPKKFLESLGFEWRPKLSTHVTRFEVTDVDDIKQVGVEADYSIKADQQKIEYDFNNLLLEAFKEFDRVQTSRNMGLTLNHFLKEVLGYLSNGDQKLTYPFFQKIVMGTSANEERFLQLLEMVLNSKTYENENRRRYSVELDTAAWKIPEVVRVEADSSGDPKQFPDFHYLYSGGRPQRIKQNTNEGRFADEEVMRLARTFSDRDHELLGYFKAGENNKEWLGIPYPYTPKMQSSTVEHHLFYPDWFFLYIDPSKIVRILVVETKKEKVTQDTSAKAKAFKTWLADQAAPIIGCVANFNDKGRAVVLEDGRMLHEWLDAQLRVPAV